MTAFSEGGPGRAAGKVAIVTGGAGGIGAAIVRRLAAEGAAVVVADVLDRAGHDLVADCGSRARFVHHDVTLSTDWDALVARTEAEFGPVSVLVNNAGVIQWNTPIVDLVESDYRRVIDVNQVGVFLGMKACADSLARAGRASIINFSSTAGLTGNAGLLAYVASKWAVRGMTKTAALEFGHLGVRVNSVHPGRFDTAMTDGLPQPLEQPIPGAGRVEDLAALVLFLASDESRYCTGSEFVMDGGQLAGRMTRLGAQN